MFCGSSMVESQETMNEAFKIDEPKSFLSSVILDCEIRQTLSTNLTPSLTGLNLALSFLLWRTPDQRIEEVSSNQEPANDKGLSTTVV